jgi:hypothetical protein
MARMARPPIITRANFREFEIFRETFMIDLPSPEVQAAVRLLSDQYVESSRESGLWTPKAPNEGWFRAEIRAHIADLRYYQFSIATLEGSDDDPFAQHLADEGRKIGKSLGKLLDAFEKELGPWRG